MTSIRRLLTRQILLGTLGLLLLVGALAGFVLRARLVHEFDRALEAKARALVAVTSREGRRIDIDFRPEAMPEFGEDEEDEEQEQEQDGEDAYFEIFFQNGGVVRRSPSLEGDDLPRLGEHTEKPIFGNVKLRDGRHGRLVQLAFVPRADPVTSEVEEPLDPEQIELPAGIEEQSLRLILVVARDRERLDALLASVYLTLAILTALLLAGIAFLVRRSVQRGFQPIDAIDTQIRSIGPETLEGRIKLASSPAELTAIVTALNALLERVESGFARERRFSSDVAHELRTPVAELRAAAEVGAKWPEDPAAMRFFFTDIREIALQMERIVSNLLTLTRCDSGTATIERTRVHLAALVEECSPHALGKAGSARFQNRVDPTLTVEIDRDKLAMILQNLLGNAAAHSVPQTPIQCESASTDGRIEIILTNQAANLAEEDLPHVFERFWQKDSARADHNRSGLGLSIVKALSDLLGLRLETKLQGDSRFEVRLSFPKISSQS